MRYDSVKVAIMPCLQGNGPTRGVEEVIYRMKMAVVAAFLSFSLSALADVTGVVVRVADGDTVTVLDADKTQHKVRVAGIDAPEKAQPFGQRAKQRMPPESVA